MGRAAEAEEECRRFYTVRTLRDVAVSLGCAQLVRRVVMTEHDIDILVPVGV